MKSKDLNNNEKIEKLLDFMRDTQSVEKLSSKIRGINIFDVLKISRTEIRHSNMLAWLLDPNENHGLGSAFLYGIIASLSDVIDNKDKIYALKLLSSDLSSFDIFRERDNIDILLVSSELNTVIAIENKIGSKEHNYGNSDESQLKKYAETIRSKYKDYHVFLVFLTPEGDETDEDDWKIMDYSQVVKILESVYDARKNNLGMEVSMLIRNYIETIKMNVIMDEKLVNLCNEIYKKHKEAIDLINEYKDDKTQQISDLCREILKKYDGHALEFDDKKSTKTNIVFKTNKLQNAFEKYTKIECFFQIRIRAKYDYIMIELVFHNLDKKNNDDEKLRNDMKALAKNSKSNLDRTEWEWKRVWSERKYDLDATTDDEMKEWITKQIEESLKMGK